MLFLKVSERTQNNAEACRRRPLPLSFYSTGFADIKQANEVVVRLVDPVTLRDFCSGTIVDKKNKLILTVWHCAFPFMKVIEGKKGDG